MRLVALAILLAGCANAARQAARDRLPQVPAADRPLGERLVDADRIVAGRISQVEEASEYEPLGSIVFGLFGSKVVLPAAYSADLRVDSTLLGGARSMLRITFFAPRGAPVPQAGDAAIWVLRRRPLWRLQRCSEQQSLTSAACPYDIGLTLDSDDDIRPIAEWPRLRAVLRTLRLGPASSTE